MEQGNNAPQPIRIGAGEEQQITGMGGQSRSEQGGHQGVGFGEIEIEPLTPVALQLGHGRKGQLDRLQRAADAPEAATQLGRFRCGELRRQLRLQQIVFPLENVGGQAGTLAPEGIGEIGQPGDAIATDQPLPLPILQAGLHGWFHRIRWAGLVQQQQVHRLLA